MRTTETEPAAVQQYAIQFVPDDALPPEQSWALVKCECATYLFVRESEVTPEALEQAWAAFRWLALNRPATRPNVPAVLPAQRASLALREAVIRGHQAMP